ncbi:MAG: hypothetical protein AB7F50_06765 [Fimbriimonadaceae bacterium]
MYILNWDHESRLLEANLAGIVTEGEADAFLDDLRALLREAAHSEFAFILDAGRARQSGAVSSTLEDARTMAIFAGATRLRCILNDEEELFQQVERRLEPVLGGTEVYELRAA